MCSGRNAFPTSFLLLACLANVGCPSPRAVYGNTAFYSPDHRGYVVSVDVDGNIGPRDSRDARGPWIALRDPITLDKVRCREDVASVLAANSDGLAALNRDRNANEASLYSDPAIVSAGYTVAGLGYALVDFTAAPYWAESPRSPPGVMNDGLLAFRSGDYPRASHLLEAALLRNYWYGDDLFDNLRYAVAARPPRSMGETTHALYYLGLAYEQERQNERAVRALRAFVNHSLVSDAAAYEVAEARLARLGHPMPPCVSSLPVAITWPEVR